MPRHGQVWDARLSTSRDEFAPFCELLAELVRSEQFPDPSQLTLLAEQARLQRAPELRALKFVVTTPKARRRRRYPVRLSELYDARIARFAEVPCYRQSYHDLFNALMFAAFPRAKRALHERQYRALEGWVLEGAERLPERRTREQDALTLMDEGGSVVLCRPDWKPAFEAGQTLTLSGTATGARLVVFGHALLEHLAEGIEDMRSSARILWLCDWPSGSELLEVVDRFLCGLLADETRFCQPDADAVVEWRPGEPPRLSHV